MISFEYHGLWWLPGSELEEAISGTLTFSPIDGATLRLLGSFREFAELISLDAIEIILGFSDAGKRITLYKCHETGGKMSFPGLRTSSFRAGIVLEGHHFERVEDLTFSRATVAFEHLSHWARRSGIHLELEALKNRPAHKWTAIFSPPADLEVSFADLRLRLFAEFSHKADLISYLHWEQETFIELSLRESRRLEPLERFLNEYFYHLRNFISLGIGEATHPSSIYVQLPAPDSGDHAYTERVNVYYRTRQEHRSGQEVDVSKEVFRLKDIEEHLGVCLESWFAKSALLKPVYNLYFGTLFAPDTYLESQFLSLMQALETYHRRTRNGTYLPKSTFRQFLRATRKFINDAHSDLPESVREVFCDKLAYHNEYTQRTRMNELLHHHRDRTIGIIPNLERFVIRAVEVRNYLTHYPEGAEVKAASVSELYHMVRQLQFLLEVVFLEEMGLPAEQVDMIAREQERYLRLRELIGRHAVSD